MNDAESWSGLNTVPVMNDAQSWAGLSAGQPIMGGAPAQGMRGMLGGQSPLNSLLMMLQGMHGGGSINGLLGGGNSGQSPLPPSMQMFGRGSQGMGMGGLSRGMNPQLQMLMHLMGR